MAFLVRPLEVDDRSRLDPIDTDYARRHGEEPTLTVGSATFYARTGHAFVAEEADRARGFVLAQPVWDGARATLRVARLAVADGDAEARRALLEAVVKSAYDAAVYRLVAEVPREDEAAGRAFLDGAWRPAPRRAFELRLGSGGEA